METLLIQFERTIIKAYENLHYTLILASEWTLNCFKFLVISIISYNIWCVFGWIFNFSMPFKSNQVEFDIDGTQTQHNKMTLFQYTIWIMNSTVEFIDSHLILSMVIAGLLLFSQVKNNYDEYEAK